MLKAAIVNLLGGATLTPSTEATGYPVSRLALAKPDQPWKTTTISGTQFAQVDYGSAKSVGALAAIGANYTSALFAANSAASWGSPAKSAALTLGRNPANQRTCLIHEPSDGPWTYRYNRWEPQGPTHPVWPETVAASVYRTGYLFPCVVEEFRNWAWDWDDTHDQEIETTKTLGGAEEDNILGPLLYHPTVPLKPLTMVDASGARTTTKFLGDQVDDLYDFFARWRVAGAALIRFDPLHPYWVAVMKLVSYKPKPGYPVTEIQVEMKEVI